MRHQFNHRLSHGPSRSRSIITANKKPTTTAQQLNKSCSAEKKVAKQPVARVSIKNYLLATKLNFFKNNQKIASGGKIQGKQKPYFFNDLHKLTAEPVIQESNIGISLLGVVALIFLITTLMMISKLKKPNSPDKTEEVVDEVNKIDIPYKPGIAKSDIDDQKPKVKDSVESHRGRALLGAAILGLVAKVLALLSGSKNNPKDTKKRLDEVSKQGINKMLKIMAHYHIDVEDLDTAISNSLSTIQTADVYEGSETYNAVNLLQHALKISFESGDLNHNSLIERVRDNIWAAYQSHTVVFVESKYLQLNRAIEFIHNYSLPPLTKNLNASSDEADRVSQQLINGRIGVTEYEIPEILKIDWNLYRDCSNTFASALIARERIEFNRQMNSDNFLKEINEILQSLKPPPSSDLLENSQSNDQENQFRPK